MGGWVVCVGRYLLYHIIIEIINEFNLLQCHSCSFVASVIEIVTWEQKGRVNDFISTSLTTTGISVVD